MFYINFDYIKVLLPSCLLIFSTMCANDLHVASLPSLMEQLNTSQDLIQYSVTLCILGQSLSIILYGILSDCYGRRPIVIVGLIIAAVSSFMTSISNEITLLLISRFFTGVGSGTGIGIARVIIVDYFKDKNLALASSIFSLSFLISPIIAPILGGFIQNYFGWQSNFYLLTAIFVISMLTFFKLCPETLPTENRNSIKINEFKKNLFKITSNSVFICCTLLSGICLSIFMSFITVSPFLFQVYYNFTSIEFGIICFIISIGNILGKVLLSISINRYYKTTIILTGSFLILIPSIILSICYVFNVITQSFLSAKLIIFFLFIILIGPSLITPIIGPQALVGFHNQRGLAGSCYACFGSFISFLICHLLSYCAPDKEALLLVIIYVILGLSAITITSIISNKIKGIGFKSV